MIRLALRLAREWFFTEAARWLLRTGGRLSAAGVMLGGRLGGDKALSRLTRTRKRETGAGDE